MNARFNVAESSRSRVTHGERKNSLFPLPRGRHIFLITSRGYVYPLREEHSKEERKEGKKGSRACGHAGRRNASGQFVIAPIAPEVYERV